MKTDKFSEKSIDTKLNIIATQNEIIRSENKITLGYIAVLAFLILPEMDSLFIKIFDFIIIILLLIGIHKERKYCNKLNKSLKEECEK